MSREYSLLIFRLNGLSRSNQRLSRMFVEQDDPQAVYMPARDAVTPASLPSLAWSNLQITDGAPATQSTGTLLSTYLGPQFDTSLLIPSFQNLELHEVRIPTPFVTILGTSWLGSLSSNNI